MWCAFRKKKLRSDSSIEIGWSTSSHELVPLLGSWTDDWKYENVLGMYPFRRSSVDQRPSSLLSSSDGFFEHTILLCLAKDFTYLHMNFKFL